MTICLSSLHYGGDEDPLHSLPYLLRRFVIFSCLNFFCLSNIGEPFHNSWGSTQNIASFIQRPIEGFFFSNMSELRLIVDRLNDEPFNKKLTLVSHAPSSVPLRPS